MLILELFGAGGAVPGGGGTHLEKAYGDVRPLEPPFHALSAVPLRPTFQHVSVL